MRRAPRAARHAAQDAAATRAVRLAQRVHLSCREIQERDAREGLGLSIAPAAGSTEEFKALAAKTPTFASVLEHTVPQSFFEAAANNEVLQIVFFAIIFAVALSRVEGPSKKIMLDGLQAETAWADID
mgnify:CR=1 FL=1